MALLRQYFETDFSNTLRVHVTVDTNLGSVEELEKKRHLIEHLILAVKSAACTVAFAVQPRPFKAPGELSLDDAIARGVAMGSEPAIEWNWQMLEIDHSNKVLIVDGQTCYGLAQGDGIDETFGVQAALSSAC